MDALVQDGTDLASDRRAPGTDPGQQIWMLNGLMTVVAGAAETGGAYSLLHHVHTPAGNPPPHVHDNEDEALYVLSGEVEVTVGGESTILGRGGFAFAPRGIEHVYAVRSEVAEILVIATPGGIEHFFAEVGEPAAEPVLPEPAAPDVEHVVRTAARHGVEIVLP